MFKNLQIFVAHFQGMNKEILEIGQTYKEPENFQEAWNHPDPIWRKLWRDAITKEYTDKYEQPQGMGKNEKKSNSQE